MKSLRILADKILTLLLLLMVVDLLTGAAAGYLLDKQKDGRYFKCQYTLQKTHEDIIILGSSRAEYNYNPAAIRKVLGMSCWNAGSAGQSILYFSTIEKVILNRYSPRLIILNMDLNALESDPDYDRMAILRPFARYNPEIFQTLSRKDSREKYKLRSNIYTCNSILFYFTRPFFLKNKDGKPADMGWKSRTETVSSVKIEQDSISRLSARLNRLNPMKAELFDEMLALAKQRNSRIIVTFCPDYFPALSPTPTKDYIMSVCRLKNVEVIDFTKNTTLTGKQDLFYDTEHFNVKGANLFSVMLAEKVREYLQASPGK